MVSANTRPPVSGGPPAGVQKYDSPVPIAWCPGCGNFGILRAMKRTLSELKIEPQQVLFVSGIGQAGKFPHYLKCNTLNELHGRTLPAAAAARIVNPKLTVIAEGGDGDGYGEGLSHFINAAARNIKITYVVHDNKVYALTKGQFSPTSQPGFVTKTSPNGAGEPLNPLALAIAANASFVARSFSADTEHLVKVLKMAIQHKGFALVDVFQPCVTYNRVNTYEFYQKHLYKLEEDHAYDPSDRMEAFKRSFQWGEKIPIGVFYTAERPLHELEQWVARGEPLVKQNMEPMKFDRLLEEYT